MLKHEPIKAILMPALKTFNPLPIFCRRLIGFVSDLGHEWF
jgi:hypothetical protein